MPNLKTVWTASAVSAHLLDRTWAVNPIVNGGQGNLTDAWFAGGQTNFSNVARINFATDNLPAVQKGNLSNATAYAAGVGNTTDGWVTGGQSISSVDRINFATDTSTATAKAALNATRTKHSASGNYTDGWLFNGSGNNASTAERITYANDTSTPLIRGTTEAGVTSLQNGVSVGNSTDAWITVRNDKIRKTTYANDTSTATERATYPVEIFGVDAGLAGTGNTTDGWFSGGTISISGLPNTAITNGVFRLIYSSDTTFMLPRGPLTVGTIEHSASGNLTDGWFAGGKNSDNNFSKVERMTYSNDTFTMILRGSLPYIRNGMSALT